MNDKYYARWKLSHSKPIEEDHITIHISIENGNILCGIDKKFPDVYEIGFEEVELNEANLNSICKLCKRKLIKKK